MLIQLLNTENEPIGLYLTPSKFTKDELEKIFQEAEEKLFQENPEDLQNEFDTYLEDKYKIERYFADEIVARHM